ncbi:MAG: 2TM domain-containing protein [Flavobacteriaceae bacterium]
MNEEGASFDDSDHIQELLYVSSKKKVKEIKGFYAFLLVTIITIPLIIFINLKFAPEFHFFWFIVIGMCFALFMMWLGIFGFDKLGMGKNWEARKIKEFIEEHKKR